MVGVFMFLIWNIIPKNQRTPYFWNWCQWEAAEWDILSSLWFYPLLSPFIAEAQQSKSIPSCGWALTRNNYTRKMSCFLFLHPSVFKSVSIYPQPWLPRSFLLHFFCRLVLFLFCTLPWLCFCIIPSSSFVVLCHSFLQCIVSPQPPLLTAFVSLPLYPNYEMLQSSFRYLPTCYCCFRWHWWWWWWLMGVEECCVTGLIKSRVNRDQS